VWLVTQGRPGGALTGDDAPDGFIAGFDGFMLPSPARLAIA
jgi:hypothetical protein